MILRCRLCHAPIAACDPARLTPPLTSAVFEPLEPGFPPPFPPDVPWEAARCPQCRHHPQGYAPDGAKSLETDQGTWPLPGSDQPDAASPDPKPANPGPIPKRDKPKRGNR